MGRHRPGDTRPALRIEMQETSLAVRNGGIHPAREHRHTSSPRAYSALLYFVFRSMWLVSLTAAIAVPHCRAWPSRIYGRHTVCRGYRFGAMLFGLVLDGVVLLYVSHRLALDGGLERATPFTPCRPIEEHAARMWTTARRFRLMFVDFPSLQELGGWSTQHGSCADWRRCFSFLPRFLVGPRRSARAGAAWPRDVDRRPSKGIICGSSRPPCCRRSRIPYQGDQTLERLRSGTEALHWKRDWSTFGLRRSGASSS